MARLLTFWVNGKFSLFRNRLAAIGIRASSEVKAQFTRSDVKLAALRDPQYLLTTAASSGKQRRQDRSQRVPKQNTGFIPPAVFLNLPTADAGRRLCLKYLSNDDCKVTKSAHVHFRPNYLVDKAQAHVSEKWNGLAAHESKYKASQAVQHERFMTTLRTVRKQHQRSIIEHCRCLAVEYNLEFPTTDPVNVDHIDQKIRAQTRIFFRFTVFGSQPGIND
ncbi:Hypothetical protein PHPALM_14281 [Phytophthora palmivora]|uniref:Uncharacterized protein n=1 Tax=Phytophthora palmivora TaxID=4796 RepID=A0A2P4XV77_9STRA|nr:Hypothetical protein PHPALM_14281 [Phytophthora palmivora]